MQIFGIISLLITVALGVWFISKNIETVQTENGSPSTYQDAIQSAKDVAGQASEKAAETNAVMGKTVTVYEGIAVAADSKVLNLASKKLSGSLKAEVRQLTELREINLSNNKFTGVPAEIGQLSKLEVLNLSNNPLTGLPQELGNLKALKTLDLRDTQYSKQDLVVIKKSLPATTQVLVD